MGWFNHQQVYLALRVAKWYSSRIPIVVLFPIKERDDSVPNMIRCCFFPSATSCGHPESWLPLFFQVCLELVIHVLKVENIYVFWGYFSAEYLGNPVDWYHRVCLIRQPGCEGQDCGARHEFWHEVYLKRRLRPKKYCMYAL